MFFYFLVSLLLGSALASVTIDVSVECGVTAVLTFSDDGSEVSPHVPCSANCNLGDGDGWLRQTIYQRYARLEGFNQMVEASFSGDEQVSCRLVPTATDEEINAMVSYLGDYCEIDFDEEQPVSDELVQDAEEAIVEESPCPEDYFYVEELDTCYLISDIEAQWYDAECSCAATGGTLAIIDSEEEQQLLASYLEDSVWIGLSDEEVESVHLWRDGTSLSYTGWANMEPSNSGSDGCVEMAAELNFAWNDEDCKEQRRYLCEERDPVEIPTCPDNWVMSTDDTKCFRLVTSKQNWSKSQTACIAYGGDLASFDSAVQFEFAKTLVSEDSWIGLNDMANEGVMVFSDLTDPGYRGFDAGEPNNRGYIEDCVEMRRSKNFNLNDAYCGRSKKALCSVAPTMVSESDVKVAECPDGWTTGVVDKCYLQSDFTANRAEAASYCATWAKDGQLVSPESEEENSFIAGIIPDQIWLGYSDLVTEGIFLKDNGEEMTYENFASNEPNNFWGNEDCASMRSPSGQWNDRSCSRTMGFICEIPKNT